MGNKIGMTVAQFNVLMNDIKQPKASKKKTGSFQDSLGPEDRLQSSCLNWLRLQHPDLLWHHSPNEGKRGKFERYKMKCMGVKSGFPDLIIFNSFGLGSAQRKGLAIEFKATTGVTEKQQQWLNDLSKHGFFVEVIRNFEDFEQLINNCYAQK